MAVAWWVWSLNAWEQRSAGESIRWVGGPKENHNLRKTIENLKKNHRTPQKNHRKPKKIPQRGGRGDDFE